MAINGLPALKKERKISLILESGSSALVKKSGLERKKYEHFLFIPVIMAK